MFQEAWEKSLDPQWVTHTPDLRGSPHTSLSVGMSSGLSPARGSPRQGAGLPPEGVSLWEMERYAGQVIPCFQRETEA